MSLRKLFYTLPPGLRLLAFKIVYGPGDFWNYINGKQQEMVPPRSKIYTGRGDFISQGKLHLKYLVEYGGLKQTDHVLDIGSGIGRTAVALTSYLKPEAIYEGFDTVKKGVAWSRNNISTKYPNFNFQYIPLANDLYNKHTLSAREFEFPYQAKQFDVCCLMSVFTHMQPGEIENYIHQCGRVLRNGGRVVATFFIYTDVMLQEKKVTNEEFGFPVDKGYYRLMNSKVTAANVALSYEHLEKQMLVGSGLRIKEWIAGYWSEGAPRDNRDFQDIIVFEKI